MGHYAAEMIFESPEEKKERQRRGRIEKRLRNMSIGAFTASELAALLMFLGFEKNQPPFLDKDEAVEVLDRKLREMVRGAKRTKR